RARVQRGVSRRACPSSALARLGRPVAVGLGADTATGGALRQRDGSVAATPARRGWPDHRRPQPALSLPAERLGRTRRPTTFPDVAEAQGWAAGRAFLADVSRA